MSEKRRSHICFLHITIIFSLFLVAAIPTKAQAQLSNPYIAVLGGQTNANWSRGYASETLEWRPNVAVELGFQFLGLTISPGFMGMAGADWFVEDEGVTYDYHLQYRAVYLNVGAREEFGVYFSGGLNFTLWDVVPQPPGAAEPFTVDGEIGFQAFLGFIYSFENLPLKLLIEAGYAQFNGNGKPLPPDTPADFYQVSSTGPMVRLGIAIGK